MIRYVVSRLVLSVAMVLLATLVIFLIANTVPGDPVLTALGDMAASDPAQVAEFRARWVKYLQLKPQIQRQYPQAVRVDLRFKNQVIIKMKDDDTSEKVVWGEKKNTL